jgi:hypothetical protein
MRKTLVVSLMLIPSLALAAQFTISGTYPTNDNSGTCSAPVLIPNASSNVVVHFHWEGTAAGEDSIKGAKGFAFTFKREVPQGSYNVRVWPTDGLEMPVPHYNVGCDTTLQLNVVTDTKPQLPRLTGRGY